MISEEVREIILGLYEIAVIAMPGSYVQTDSRTVAARRLLKIDEFSEEDK